MIVTITSVASLPQKQEENMHAKSYQLHIRVKTPVRIAIGKLGTFEFPAGEYVYTGSGKTNIKERVSRHLSRSKHLRWHIDYLLSNPEVELIGYTLSEEPECYVNRKTAGDVIVPRFGSTDCRSGRGSHLKFTVHLWRSDE
jgi:Uri superfamily endonuclease